MPQAVIAGSCTVAGQVAEVRTSLAVVAPWLWLMKRVKLAEFLRIELVRTRLAQTEPLWTELVWMELVRAELVQTEVAQAGLVRVELV